MKRKCAHPHLCKAEELGTILACRQGKKIKKKNKRKERRSKGRNGGRFLPGTKPVSEKGEFPLKSFFFASMLVPLFVQVFSESHGSHNRFRLMALFSSLPLSP